MTFMIFSSRIVHSELSIPVAASAPDGYLNSRFGGLGKVTFPLLMLQLHFYSINYNIRVTIIYYTQ